MMRLGALSVKLKKDNPPGDQEDVCAFPARAVIPLADILRSPPPDAHGIVVKTAKNDPYWGSRPGQYRKTLTGPVPEHEVVDIRGEEEFEDEDGDEQQMKADIVHSIALLIRCRDLLKELDRICERCDLTLPADTDLEMGTLIDDAAHFIAEFSDVEWLAVTRELNKVHLQEKKQ